MYQFVDATWNPIKGKCEHDCSYCYMKKWGEQNILHLDSRELVPLGANNFIFCGSSTDMFAKNVPVDWIQKVLNHCDQYLNKYLFQSKNPARILEFKLPESVICTTIETNRNYINIMGFAPTPQERAKALSSTHMEKYVTIEPIMEFDHDEMVDLIKECAPEQVNIGADSGGHNLPEPSKEKVLALIDALSGFTTIHNKKNLKRLL